MFSPLKLVVPLVVGTVGLATAIPLTTPSHVQNNVHDATNNSLKLEDSSDLKENTSSKSSDFLNSVPDKNTEDSSDTSKKKVDRCKVIVSEAETGKLEMCFNQDSESKVEFIFYQEIVASSIPIKVKELTITYKDLVLELAEKVEYSNTRRFDLPQSFYGEKSDVVVSGNSKTNKKFVESDCKVEWIDSVTNNERINWRAKCTSSSN